MNSIFCKSVALTKWTIGLTLSAALVACGGSGGGTTPPPVSVATADTTAPVTSTTMAALVSANATPIVATFNSGFSGVDAAGAPANVSGATTLSFTSAGTPAVGTTPAKLPAFRIENGGNWATGGTTFHSCDFAIVDGSFPADSPLAVGKVLVVDPCSLAVSTNGAKANGTANMSNVTLQLGSTVSTNMPLPVAISSTGSVSIGSTTLGTVHTTPITGAGS